MNTLLSSCHSTVVAIAPRRVCGLKPASFPVRRFIGELALRQRTAGMAVWVLLGLLALAGLPQAQGAGPSVIETRLHSFGDPLTDAAYTSAPVTEGSDGKLYGTTRQGGVGYGTVFRVNKDGSGFTVIKSLNGGTDGVSPCGAVTEGSDGALYGTANGGGSFGNGTVFRVNKDGSNFAVLKNLSYATDGSSPQAGVIEGSDGALYGTTNGGGSLGYGTVFRVNKDGSGFAVLRSLNSATDGRYPYGAVTEGSDGALYGTTIGGGSMGNGTVFRVNKNGSGFTVLKNFIYSTDGGAPYGAVTEGNDGALYGTTYSGGSMGNGTVFRVNKDGGGFAVLRTLNGSTDGRNAYAGVTEGSDGALYGTTYSGGSFGNGTAFRVNKDGTGFTVLKNLIGGVDGANPFAGLTESSDGVLYGTAYSGGSMGYGSVFRMNKDGGGFAVLKSLNGGTDGANPYARLTEGSDGALYGTAYSGGASSAGTVFRVNKDGSGFTVLKNLTYATDGGNPSAAVIEGSDGALYGTAYTGGSMGNGTVFRMNKDGSGFAVLRSLNGGTDGRSPFAGLTEGSDGALYGSANGGGSFDNGTVFRVNKNGSGFTVLRSLNGGTDGANPYAAVAEGSDGALYGTACYRGSMGYGTVFRVNKDGSGFTVLRHLSYFTDGANPQAALTEGSDGALYGTAVGGGSWGYGTVFRLNKDGSGFELLQAFGGAAGGPRNPRGQLLRGNDARLYGTSGQGGDANVGTVFALQIVVPNQPPVAGDDTYSVAEDTTLTVAAPGVLGNDSDPESATLTATVATPPAHGALTLHADGSFYYTPAANYNGPDSFTYTVSDPAGNTASATVNLTVNPVDDPTVLAADAANVVVNEGSPATMTGTFSDVEGNGSVLLAVSVGTITQDNEAGTWSWTYTPADGPSSIQVFVTANGGTQVGFEVDVLDVPASFDLGPDVTLPPSANGRFAVDEVTFADPGDDIWSIYINYGDGSPIEQFPSQPGVRAFSLLHHYAASGTYTVTVDISGGATDTMQVTVQRNHAPVATAQSLTSAEDTPLAIALAGTDSDADPLTFGVVNGPAHGTLSGTAPNLTYTPGANYHGTDSFTFKVHDGAADSAPATVSITVTPVNDGDPGDVEPGFNPNLFGLVTSEAVQADGKVVIGGNFTQVDGTTRNHIARLNPNGTLDPGFHPDVNHAVYSIAVQRDGKIVIGGLFTTVNGTARNRIARLGADGTLEANFDPDLDNPVFSCAVQADGKIVIGGYFTSVGGAERNHIARLNADGTPDAGFNPNANNAVWSMAAQPDGKILIGGDFTTVSGTARNRIARLNADGTLDAGFNPDANGTVFSTTVQADGRILIGGNFFAVGHTTRRNIALLNADGTVDSGFDPGADSIVFCTVPQTDGKVVIGGNFVTVAGVPRNRIARLHADGTLDTDFNPDANAAVYSAALQADGRIVLGGSFSTVGGVERSQIALLANEAATQNLTVPASNRVEWRRGGASPETLDVTFESSNDGGATWTALGPGTRTPDGWEKTGLSLSGSGQVRSRARVVSGAYGGSSGLVEAVASFSFNASPVVANPIPNQSATYGTLFTFTVPANTFSDPDAGQTLSYSATGLPAWLAFDANTRTFNGTPPAPGSFTLTVIATDDGSPALSASTTFDLVVGKAAPAITWATPAPIPSGTPLSAAQLNATANTTGSFAYTPAAGTMLPRGTHLLSAGFTPSDTVNYTTASATVSLEVLNSVPAATGQSITTAEDTARAITLAGMDADADALTYVVTGSPAHGTLSGTAPNLTYTPASNYHGPDNFTFKVNDGTADSSPASVFITVTPVNDLPTANAQSLTTYDNAPLAIALAGADIETSPLTYRIASGPSTGTLSGTPPNVTFTPPFPFAGNASFTFEVEDADGAKAQATVAITILASDRPPVAMAGADQQVVAGTDCHATVTVDGRASTDADGDALAYSWQLFLNGAVVDTVTGQAVVAWSLTHGSYEAVLTVSTDKGGTIVSRSDSLVIQVLPSAPALAALSPTGGFAGGPAFTLSVTGGCFLPGAAVHWNGSPQPTTVVSSSELKAAIPASNLQTGVDIAVASIQVINGDGQVSNPLGFSIVARTVGTADAAVALPGETSSVSTAPTTPGEPGVSVTVQNNGSEPVSVLAATYNTKPVGETAFRVDNGAFVDVQVAGANENVAATVFFYYPSDVTGLMENRVKLRYFDGANWIPVLSSGGLPPAKDTTDNLDGTVSGGRFTVVFDATSTPTIMALNGTVFGMIESEPQLGAITGPAGPVALGNAVSVTVNFAVVGDPADAEVQLLWDDGTESIVAPRTATSATATHLYPTPGVYGVTVRVTDGQGDAREGRFEYVVIYDPNGGFVTGGGWIESPAGAYLYDATLSGKATFGFNSKYVKGRSVPIGQTQFQFQAGDFKFQSTAYEWLVVSGAKAQYRGVGQVNGAGDYGFLLTATDGQINAGGGVDKFRIKIWDRASRTVVYDNRRGASDDLDTANPQAIGGGSIVIQKAK